MVKKPVNSITKRIAVSEVTIRSFKNSNRWDDHFDWEVQFKDTIASFFGCDARKRAYDFVGVLIQELPPKKLETE